MTPRRSVEISKTNFGIITYKVLTSNLNPSEFIEMNYNTLYLRPCGNFRGGYQNPGALSDKPNRSRIHSEKERKGVRKTSVAKI